MTKFGQDVRSKGIVSPAKGTVSRCTLLWFVKVGPGEMVDQAFGFEIQIQQKLNVNLFKEEHRVVCYNFENLPQLRHFTHFVDAVGMVRK